MFFSQSVIHKQHSTFIEFLMFFCYQKTDEGWREVMVDIDEDNGPHHLKFVLAPASTAASKLYIRVSLFKVRKD